MYPLDNIPQQNESSDLQLESLNHTLQENITVTCQYYSILKAYQYMLYQFLHSQDTNVSNATTTSVMYLLQTAAKSLQNIQVSLLLSMENAMHTIHIHVQWQIKRGFLKIESS